MAAARVLLAWEHGRNHGHMARLGALAQLFERSGAQLVWALPHPGGRERASARGGSLMHTVPCPAPAPLQRSAVPNSFADILVSIGFVSPDHLRAAVRGWLRLFESERIDRIVLDYAPTAQLAACIAGLPAHQITNGFDAPPPDCPPFGLRVRGPMMGQRNRERIEAIDRALAAVSRAFAVRDEISLTNWLAYPARWYDCIPETDPYGPREDGLYVGPIGRPAETVPVEWPGAGGVARVFVYLRSPHRLRPMLDALRARGASVICSCPGAGPELVERCADARIALVERPVDLTQVLPEADAIVNYGSSAMVCQSLLAGKPQLMLPADAEKWLIARRVEAADAGVVVMPGVDLDEIAATVLQRRELRNQAEAIGLRARTSVGRLEQEVHACCGVTSDTGVGDEDLVVQ